MGAGLSCWCAGDVDKGELREIVSTLARAGHTPAMINAVKDALGDGDMVAAHRRAAVKQLGPHAPRT